MTPKNWRLGDKNRTLGEDEGGQKSSKIVGHHLWMFPNENLSFFSFITFEKVYNPDETTVVCKKV